VSCLAPTHPAYGTDAEAMRQAFAPGCPPVPGRAGAVCTEEVLQQRRRVVARDRRAVGAERGGSPAREHVEDRRRQVELAGGPQAREHDKGQVVLHVCGGVVLHVAAGYAAMGSWVRGDGVADVLRRGFVGAARQWSGIRSP
jgi:hypothetical protein